MFNSVTVHLGSQERGDEDCEEHKTLLKHGGRQTQMTFVNDIDF